MKLYYASVIIQDSVKIVSHGYAECKTVVQPLKMQKKLY